MFVALDGITRFRLFQIKFQKSQVNFVHDNKLRAHRRAQILTSKMPWPLSRAVMSPPWQAPLVGRLFGGLMIISEVGRDPLMGGDHSC